MTVVCAIARGDNTWFGSDTVSVTTDGRMIECGSKWICGPSWAFGHCGDGRVADLLRLSAEHGSLFQDLTTAAGFAERLRKIYEDGGLRPTHGRDNSEQVPAWGNGGLLIAPGRVWDVDSCLCVSPAPAGVLYARGNAGDVAMAAGWGVLHVKPDASPEIVVRAALLGAAQMNVYIRGVWQGRLSAAVRPAAPARGEA